MYAEFKSRKFLQPEFQRELRIGYNRAVRIIEDMDAEGIVSPPQSGRVRNALIATSDE